MDSGLDASRRPGMTMRMRSTPSVYGFNAPCTLVYTAYSDVDPQM